MTTSHLNSTASPRFRVTRADLSPLVRRSATPSSGRAAAASRPASLILSSRASAFDAENTSERWRFPTFWTSTALTRVQPEITRYHD